MIGIIEQVCVGPLEVEAQIDRFAHARIAEAFAALVDRPSLHERALFPWKCAFDDLVLLNGREIISRGPVLRYVLGSKIDVALFEGFEFWLSITVELNADAVEVAGAALHR
ncbi:hypothetical protein FQZ97_831470 [compost metagenome]